MPKRYIDHLTSKARLKALRATSLLDSAPEESFDRLTRLVAGVLGVPVSLVSLVDTDRQFFKSQVGLSEPWAHARQTPLSHSFCQYVVASKLPFLVENASANETVRDNLAVSELGVMSYLGVPLKLDDGNVLGALCAIDVAPRRWSPSNLCVMADLASCVMTEIELRKTIGEHAKAVERARNASRMAKRASRAKTEYVTSICHEIRGPLTAIIGYTELALKTIDESPPIRRYVETIDKAGSALLRLVNDELDLARIEAGKIQFCKRQFSISALINNCIELYRNAAREKGVGLSVHISNEVEDSVLGDVDRLRQVLVNLVSNAIKATLEGQIDIEVERVPSQVAKNVVRFVIKDTGIGVPPEHRKRLFKRFSQATNARAGDPAGSGLGLAICKQLLEAMGGKIGYYDRAEGGSVFSFAIDLPTSQSGGEQVSEVPTKPEG